MPKEGHAGTRYSIDSRSAQAKCQVTKGAHVWSWRKACIFCDLRGRARHCAGARCAGQAGSNHAAL